MRLLKNSIYFIFAAALMLSGCFPSFTANVPNHCDILDHIPSIKMLETGNTIMREKVNKGDCLSVAIERSITRYIKSKGFSSDCYINYAIYKIVDELSRTSFKHRNPNLIYPGEVIQFRLPGKIFISESLPYYKSKAQKHGFERLRMILGFEWEVEYKAGYFDCSERSAFVEYLLQNSGFGACIIEDSSHCWVMVEVFPDKFVHIEAVASPPRIIEERTFSTRYNTIYQALERNFTEYDWWNVAKKNKEFIRY